MIYSNLKNSVVFKPWNTPSIITSSPQTSFMMHHKQPPLPYCPPPTSKCSIIPRCPHHPEPLKLFCVLRWTWEGWGTNFGKSTSLTSDSPSNNFSISGHYKHPALGSSLETVKCRDIPIKLSGNT